MIKTTNLEIKDLLLIEPDEQDRQRILSLLHPQRTIERYETKFNVTVATTLLTSVERLSQNSYDAILMDLRMPDSIGMQSLSCVMELAGSSPVIVLTEDSSVKIASEVLRLGAQDFVSKDEVCVQVLVRSLLHAIERQRRLLAEQRFEASEADRRAAGMVQSALFPNSPITQSNVQIAGGCQQAEHVGGDYYDFFEMENGCVGLAVGDVSSHGFAPALIMAGLRRLLRTLIQTTSETGKIVTLANRAICEDTLGEQFVTLFLARIDLRNNSLVYTAAGHPGFLIDQSGCVQWLDECLGLPLGIDESLTYATSDPISLSDQRHFLAATDGFWEAMNRKGEFFGFDAIFDTFRKSMEPNNETATQVIQHLFDDVAKFRAGQPATDDCAIVTAKFC